MTAWLTHRNTPSLRWKYFWMLCPRVVFLYCFTLFHPIQWREPVRPKRLYIRLEQRVWSGSPCIDTHRVLFIKKIFSPSSMLDASVRNVEPRSIANSWPMASDSWSWIFASLNFPVMMGPYKWVARPLVPRNTIVRINFQVTHAHFAPIQCSSPYYQAMYAWYFCDSARTHTVSKPTEISVMLILFWSK